MGETRSFNQTQKIPERSVASGSTTIGAGPSTIYSPGTGVKALIKQFAIELDSFASGMAGTDRYLVKVNGKLAARTTVTSNPNDTFAAGRLWRQELMEGMELEDLQEITIEGENASANNGNCDWYFTVQETPK